MAKRPSPKPPPPAPPPATPATPATPAPAESAGIGLADALRLLWYSPWRWMIVAVATGLVALIGWGVFDRWQGLRANTASDLHARLERALEVLQRGENPEALAEARMLVEVLRTRHVDSTYTIYGALMWGARLAENGELATAEELFSWIEERSQDFDLKAIAGLHRAKVALARGDYEEALNIVKNTDSDIVTPMFREIQGDIARETGQSKAALKLYREAERLYQGTSTPKALRFKIQEMESRANTSGRDG